MPTWSSCDGSGVVVGTEVMGVAMGVVATHSEMEWWLLSRGACRSSWEQQRKASQVHTASIPVIPVTN
jgi:hypothetical protein